MKTNNIIPPNKPINIKPLPKKDKEKIKQLDECKKKALNEQEIIKK